MQKDKDNKVNKYNKKCLQKKGLEKNPSPFAIKLLAIYFGV